MTLSTQLWWISRFRLGDFFLQRVVGRHSSIQDATLENPCTSTIICGEGFIFAISV
jgi:hypothetical protein